MFHRDNVKNDVCGFIQLIRHGTPYQGPVGEEIITQQFHVPRDQARTWQNDCHGKTQSCMQGPSDESLPNHEGGTFGARCKGLHPLPVMFHCVLELEPGVRWKIRLYFYQSCNEDLRRFGLMVGNSDAPSAKDSYQAKPDLWPSPSIIDSLASPPP